MLIFLAAITMQFFSIVKHFRTIEYLADRPQR